MPVQTRSGSSFRFNFRFQAFLTLVLAVLVMGAVFVLAPGPIKPTSARAATTPYPGTLGGQAATAPAGLSAVAALGQGKLSAYAGLGAWVSLYDYDLTSQPMNPENGAAVMAARGIKVLYLQTSRWNMPNDIDAPGPAGRFIDAAHAHGIKVVGWYLPGFADVGRDVNRSIAVLRFTSPKGGHFDSVAPDIEDMSAVGGNAAAFNAGIISYSHALRALVGPNVVLGAITVDAVNDRRAPATWAGFPWRDIAKMYDVILPMGYWSVTKPKFACALEYDAGGYTRDVIATTSALMGTIKPMVMIGGIGDCNTLSEVKSYALAARATGMLGASIYSFQTVQDNPQAEAMWKVLQTTAP